MTVNGESVVRPLFRTSCIQRVRFIFYYLQFFYLGNFICANVHSKVVEATAISRSFHGNQWSHLSLNNNKIKKKKI
jgi:hypothetical protein